MNMRILIFFVAMLAFCAGLSPARAEASEAKHWRFGFGRSTILPDPDRPRPAKRVYRKKK